MFAVQQKKHYLCINNFRHMITYTKQPISIADQIAMLKNRGLLFEK